MKSGEANNSFHTLFGISSSPGDLLGGVWRITSITSCSDIGGNCSCCFIFALAISSRLASGGRGKKTSCNTWAFSLFVSASWLSIFFNAGMMPLELPPRFLAYLDTRQGPCRLSLIVSLIHVRKPCRSALLTILPFLLRAALYF